MKENLNYEKLEEDLEQLGPTVSVAHDPDILGAVFGQIQVLVQEIPDITEAQWSYLTKLSNHLAFKLGAVRYHCKNYGRLQEQRRGEILADPKLLDLMRKGLIDSEPDMAFEFEAWCNQVRATLEMLVQIFFPLLGSTLKDFPKSKYGNKGERLITHLESKKKNKKVMAQYSLNPEKIDHLINLIRSKKDVWVSAIVEWRDDVTHRFPYVRIAFTWDDETNQLKEPIAMEAGKERSILDIIEKVTEYLIDYTRDFIALTISCKKPSEILRRPISDLEKEYLSTLWEAEGNEIDVNSIKWRFTDAKPITENDLKTLREDIRKWQESNNTELSPDQFLAEPETEEVSDASKESTHIMKLLIFSAIGLGLLAALRFLGNK